MNWSADFQIGAWEKPGMIALIWKSALRCTFRVSMREIFRGNLSLAWVLVVSNLISFALVATKP